MRTFVDQETVANAVNSGERELTLVELAAVKALRNSESGPTIPASNTCAIASGPDVRRAVREGARGDRA
jgi:hypothetical protein